MATYQRVQTLYHSHLFSVIDVCCRPDCRRCGEEKYASDHLLVLPRAGVSVRHRSRREETIFDPTSALLINAGEASRFSHPVPGGDDFTKFEFGQEALGEFLRGDHPSAEDRPAGKWFPQPTAPISPRTALLLQRLRQHLLLGPMAFDPLEVEETVACLLTRSLQAAGGLPDKTGCHADTRRAHCELAQRARYVLSTELRQRLTLHDLARRVFSSPFHLARVFRRETGGSLHGYVLRLRLQASLEWVINQRDADLTTLALALGFASHAHFSDAFRRAFGIAPSGLRRRASGRLLKEVRKQLSESSAL